METNECKYCNAKYGTHTLSCKRKEDASPVKRLGSTAGLAEAIYAWMVKQKYGEEDLLHAAVCCDFVGMARFKKALADVIEEYQGKRQNIGTQRTGQGGRLERNTEPGPLECLVR